MSRILAININRHVNQLARLSWSSHLIIHSSQKVLEKVNSDDSRTAGIIVIGDEILKGQVHDTNSNFIAKELYKLGVKVEKISVIGDVEEMISKEVKQFSKQYTYVITTGGIGPTHDDITLQSVAKAFEEPIYPHPELVKLISHFYETNDLNSGAMKMAHIPKSAKLIYGFDEARGRKTFYPHIYTRNVYTFPGIPQLMEKLFVSVSKDLFGGGERRFFMKELYLKAKETEITSILNAVVAEFPQVTFGSYPKLFNSYYSVKITVESEIEGNINEAYNKLNSSFSKDIVEYDTAPLEDAYEKLLNVIKSSNNPVFQTAIDVIENCLEMHSPEETCIYFDGGIESTCVLHLYYALARRKNSIPKIKGFCIKNKTQLDKVEAFVSDTIFRYNMQFERFNENLYPLMSMSVHQSPIKTIIVGNITSEEKSSGYQKLLQENTPYSKIRWITPLITWDIENVWHIIRSLTLPYCILYDEGYSAVGSTKELLQAIAEMNQANELITEK